MMCSLEARSPFLDIEVVDLARRIPWQLKLRGGQTKWILKKALEPLLPREIVAPEKEGLWHADRPLAAGGEVPPRRRRSRSPA